MIYVNTPCTPYDREAPNKSQFVDKTSVEAQGYIYGRREHNSRVSTGALSKPNSSVVDTRSVPNRSPETCVQYDILSKIKYKLILLMLS